MFDVSEHSVAFCLLYDFLDSSLWFAVRLSLLIKLSFVYNISDGKEPIGGSG